MSTLQISFLFDHWDELLFCLPDFYYRCTGHAWRQWVFCITDSHSGLWAKGCLMMRSSSNNILQLWSDSGGLMQRRAWWCCCILLLGIVALNCGWFSVKRTSELGGNFLFLLNAVYGWILYIAFPSFSSLVFSLSVFGVETGESGTRLNVMFQVDFDFVISSLFSFRYWTCKYWKFSECFKSFTIFCYAISKLHRDGNSSWPVLLNLSGQNVTCIWFVY